jgi:Fe-S cluster assembly iron-binding protein IscA
MGRFQVMSMTDAAATRVREIVASRQGANGVRVGVKKGGCAGMEYTVDLVTEPNPKDDHIEHAGADVWVAPEAAQDRPILERLAARHADLGHIQQTFTIGEADIELARHLGVHEAAPIAELRRIVFDGGGTIIYFGHLFFRGDLVRLDFSVDLK